MLQDVVKNQQQKSAKKISNFNEKIEIGDRLWIPKRCKGVHCIDLGESFPNSNAYFVAKLGFDKVENEPC